MSRSNSCIGPGLHVVRLDLGKDVAELGLEAGLLLQCGDELLEGELFLLLGHFVNIIEG